MAVPAALRRPGRDRALLLAGLACVTVVGWLVLAQLSVNMAGMSGPDMAGMPDRLMAPVQPAPSPGYGLTLAMWMAMMAAMMAPATAPAAAAYIALARRRHPDRSPMLATASFVSGYLAAWMGYAALGAVAQSALASATLLTPMSAVANGFVGAAVLTVAGIYQLTPLKRVCVTHCRTPLLQLMARWRDGVGGALRLGLEHGSWCVGCCWALMSLLFVVGIMNLVWMAIVAAFVLVERLTPRRWHLDLVTGVLLTAAGGVVALVAAG